MREGLGVNASSRIRPPNLLELATRALPAVDPSREATGPSVGDDIDGLITNFHAAWGPSVGDDIAPDRQPGIDFGTTTAPPRFWSLLELAEAADSAFGEEQNLSAAWGPSVGDDVPSADILPWSLDRGAATVLHGSLATNKLSLRRLSTLLDFAETAEPSLGSESSLSAAWGPSVGDDVVNAPVELWLSRPVVTLLELAEAAALPRGVPSLSYAWGPSVGDDVAPDAIESSLDLELSATVSPRRLWTLIGLADTADQWLGVEHDLSAAWGPSVGDDVVCTAVYLY